ncbi:hypothetical protein [Amycolatopsis sp. NPDC051071]|uniref:hypothetical protein n=1 Tax=Amycolatopsis sp. NPDC051071 TaxID=3154637 RepID=UPI00341C7DC9
MDKARETATPGAHGAGLGSEVWLGPDRRRHDGDTVTFHGHRIYLGRIYLGRIYLGRFYLGGVEIGRVDCHVCHACRAVLLGEIRLFDHRRRGIGTHVLDRLRHGLPGYRWSITGGNTGIPAVLEPNPHGPPR